MKLTPMDINNKEFKRGLRGYNPEEVDEFLDEVIENYEQLYKENSKLKEKIALADDQIDHYKKIESTIQNTLLLAQNAAEQAKTSAEKEAEIVVKNANETAQKILDKAHNDVLELNDEYENMKQEFIKFRAKFRNFMNTQLQTFDDLEKDVLKNYNVSKPVSSFDDKEQSQVVNSSIDIDKDEVKDDQNESNNLGDNLSDFFSKAALEQIEEDKAEKNVSEEVSSEANKLDEEVVNSPLAEKNKEIDLGDTMSFNLDEFKSIDKGSSNDEINQIKSFFASNEEKNDK